MRALQRDEKVVKWFKFIAHINWGKGHGKSTKVKLQIQNGKHQILKYKYQIPKYKLPISTGEKGMANQRKLKLHYKFKKQNTYNINRGKVHDKINES